MTTLRISRLAAALLLLAGQLLFGAAPANALAVGESAATAEAGDYIVICTPTGLVYVAWSAGDEPPATPDAGVLCPLCVMGAAGPPTHAPTAAASAAVEHVAYVGESAGPARPSAAAPYTARAPPA